MQYQGGRPLPGAVRLSATEKGQDAQEEEIGIKQRYCPALRLRLMAEPFVFARRVRVDAKARITH
jgi:hypothetical protein